MSHKRNDLIKVKLQVKHSLSEYPGRSRNNFVAVVGPGIQLGNENPNIAPRCHLVGNNIWEKDLWLPRNSRLHYKFLVVYSCTGAVKDIEYIAPRQLSIGQSPFTIEHVYNKMNGRKIGDTSDNIPIIRRENWGYKTYAKHTQNITDSAPKPTAPLVRSDNSFAQIKDELKTETTDNVWIHQLSTEKSTDKRTQYKQDQSSLQETDDKQDQSTLQHTDDKQDLSTEQETDEQDQSTLHQTDEQNQSTQQTDEQDQSTLQQTDEQEHSTLQQTDEQEHSTLQQADEQEHSTLQKTDEPDAEDKATEPTEINENCSSEQCEGLNTTNSVLETKDSKCGLFNRKNIVIAMAGLALTGLGLVAFFRK